jgi:hypothetical protein
LVSPKESQKLIVSYLDIFLHQFFLWNVSKHKELRILRQASNLVRNLGWVLGLLILKHRLELFDIRASHELDVIRSFPKVSVAWHDVPFDDLLKVVVWLL